MLETTTSAKFLWHLIHSFITANDFSLATFFPMSVSLNSSPSSSGPLKFLLYVSNASSILIHITKNIKMKVVFLLQLNFLVIKIVNITWLVEQ